MQVQRGDVLLTSSVGGTTSTWRDRALSKSIIAHQKHQMKGFVPTRSHAGWIMGPTGETFEARWRTQRWPNGLADYIGSPITIGRSPVLTPAVFDTAWHLAGLDRLEGKFYPVRRILRQLVATWIFPWVTDIGTSGALICSEIVAKVLHYANKILTGGAFAFVECQWSGNTPGDLEENIRGDREWIVVFDGILTFEAYKTLTKRST